MQKRLDDKKVSDSEIQNLKETIEKLTKDHESTVKEKDIELREMKEHLLRVDPDFFNSSNSSGPEKIKECLDCKKK